MNKNQIGYIAEYPDGNKRFVFKEAPYTRIINSRGDKIRSKLLQYSADYEEVKDNADIMKKCPRTILVREPFLLDDELRERVTKWVAWANKADQKEYDFWA